MKNLRKTVAALGFICFVSLALLPVSLTVCGPIASRLFHHAKKLRPVEHASSPHLRVVQPLRAAFDRDVISESDPARYSWELTAARSPAGPKPDRPELHFGRGFIDGEKIARFVFHSVLIL